MPLFSWRSEHAAPPYRWDLRRVGWQLCEVGPDCRSERGQVLLIDGTGLGEALRFALFEAALHAGKLVLLGCDRADERARLLAAGCGEALPGDVELYELAARAGRLSLPKSSLPRQLMVGPIALDLFYRDARIGDRWLSLHPREFLLLWRLAECPGERVTRAQLFREVWRLRHVPETNSVEVHISRLRAKLAEVGLGELVRTDPLGGYCLDRALARHCLSRPLSAPSASMEDIEHAGFGEQIYQ